MAKNIDRLDGDGLMENYYIFSFIHLTDIYSCPGSRSGRVSIILPQQEPHTHTHTHTHRKYTFSTAVFPHLLAILYQFQIMANSLSTLKIQIS